MCSRKRGSPTSAVSHWKWRWRRYPEGSLGFFRLSSSSTPGASRSYTKSLVHLPIDARVLHKPRLVGPFSEAKYLLVKVVRERLHPFAKLFGNELLKYLFEGITRADVLIASCLITAH